MTHGSPIVHCGNRLGSRCGVSWSVGLALVIGMVAAMSPLASASVIRHDRPDANYQFIGNQPEFASVGELYQGGVSEPASRGSGVLIGRRWVVTAAHVVYGNDDVVFKLNGVNFLAQSWRAHPRFNINNFNTAQWDVAIVELSIDVTSVTGVQPVEMHSGRHLLGRKVVNVGYGITGNGVTGAQQYPPFTDAVKRGGHNRIDAFEAGGRLLFTDFDRPGTQADNPLGNANPEKFEASIASGDSGGGMFIMEDGRFKLAAVHSFGSGVLDGIPDGDYGDVNGHVNLAKHRRWIMTNARRLAAQEVKRSAPPVDYSPLPSYSYQPGYHRPRNNHVSAFNLLALSSSATPASASVAIPSPTSLAVLGVAVPCLLRRRR